MAFQVSPGVVVKEEDLSSYIPAVSSTIAGFAGHFRWGPAGQIVTVDSENNLKQLFGKPTETNYEEWFTAANFLNYGSNLKVVRTVNTDSTGAYASNSSGPSAADVGVVKLTTQATKWNTSNTVAGGSGGQHWQAKYPGIMGDSLKVVWWDGGYTTGASASIAKDGVSAGAYKNWTYVDYFTTNMPFTTGWANTLTGSDTVYDGVNVAIVDEDGEFTGTKGTVLETFNAVSKASNARNADNTSNYYKDVINDSSKYIWWLAHPYEAGSSANKHLGVSGGSQNWGTDLPVTGGTYDVLFCSTTGGYTASLGGGSGETSGSVGAVVGGTMDFGLFYDTETVDVSVLLGGPANPTLAKALVDLADTRKDCVVFLSPEKADTIASSTPRDESSCETDVLNFRNTQLDKNSSYAFLDSGWKYMYDRYSDKYRWVPLCADTAGLAVRSDEQTETWFSPAGFNRGQLRNVVKLSWNPRKAHRDNLYQDQVNPVVSFPGEGTVLWGDKTLLTKPSAFDRLNVRRLFIVLEKAISTASKYQIFEQNDEFTRSNFKGMIEPFLRDVQSRRGLSDFKVICDDTNNTSAVVDRNEFVADIFIKPIKSINYITLTFVATSQGVDFTEIGS
jgi:hypothetical protein